MMLIREWRASVSLGILAVLIACSERSNRPWDEVPRLVVAISAQAESTIVRDTVAAWPAPEIRFQAQIEADRNHMIPVTAPSTGVISSVKVGGPVAAGDTLATIGPESTKHGRLLPMFSRRPGTWRARVRPGQSVFKGDTVGLFDDHTHWLAVGSVSDYEAQFIDWGDQSFVGLDEDRQATWPGTVESIRGPNAEHRYSAEVSVDFLASGGRLESGRSATVIIRPNDPEDSVAGVPAAAVVELPLGSAVFIRLEPRLYEAQWLTPGPASRDMIIVRSGLRPRTLVVTHGLAALVAAARDSLEKGAHKGRE